MALASYLRLSAAAAGLRPTVLMSSSAALFRLSFINTRLNHGRLCGAPSRVGSSFRRSHARGYNCVAQASSQIGRCDGSQGRSPGWSEDTSATDVDVGADKDPEYHKTNLHTACARGYVKRVRMLLDQGADVNQYWKEGYQSRTPLHFAICKGNSVELVQLLLERGADLEAKDEISWTPLLTAVGQSHPFEGRGTSERCICSFAELLISAGADINAQDQESRTPLHWASMLGRVEVVRLLLKRGADVDARDESRRTPLHYAAYTTFVGAGKVVGLLAAAGADINACDKEHDTALHIAADYPNCNALRQLVKQPGVQLDARNAGGLTPVAVAVKEGRLDAVKVLQAAGADMVNPKLHKVPLLALAEKALDEVLETDEDKILYYEGGFFLQARELNRIIKYLKAELGTAAPPSTPAA